MCFTYLEALGNALDRNRKEIYCRFDITNQIQKDNWYVGKTSAKYGGKSFTYGIFTPNAVEICWIFFISNFTFYDGI